MKRGHAAVGVGLAVVAALVPAGGLPASAAQPSPPAAPVATVTAATGLSGGGGWLVWSAPDGSRYVLMGYHAGHVVKLPVASRLQPFDANVGSDTSGKPVVAFSRCRRTPEMSTVGEQGGAGGALLDPADGRGCRIHVLALGTGTETAPPIPAPVGVSDTTPSEWHGQITFARHAPSHGDVWQVETWSPSARRLQELPHGRVPTCPEAPQGCTERARGYVDALDRDGSTVTFLWELPWPQQGVIGEGAWEVRVDSADGSHAALADGGFGHEACTTAGFGGPHELEYIWPLAPIAVGTHALIEEMLAFSCFQGFASLLLQHEARPGFSSEGKLPATVLALAEDDGVLFGLVPARNAATGGDSPSCSAAEPCRIEPVAPPALRRAPRLPFVPFP